jgi:excisionase family DNA binding protein
MAQNERWFVELSTAEIAEQENVTQRTIQRRIAAGKYSAKKVGGKYRVPVSPEYAASVRDTTPSTIRKQAASGKIPARKATLEDIEREYNARRPPPELVARIRRGEGPAISSRDWVISEGPEWLARDIERRQLTVEGAVLIADAGLPPSDTWTGFTIVAHTGADNADIIVVDEQGVTHRINGIPWAIAWDIYRFAKARSDVEEDIESP